MISNNNRSLSADDEVFNPQLELNNPNRAIGSGSQSVGADNPYFQEPTFLDRVEVKITPEELRRAKTSDAPLSFFEKLQGGLHTAYLWDDPVEYRIALEDINRSGDSIIRGLAEGSKPFRGQFGSDAELLAYQDAMLDSSMCMPQDK